VKQDGAYPGLTELLVDARPHLPGFVLRLHEGDGDLLKHQRKLAQYGVAEHLGRDGGAVGYIEYGVHDALLWYGLARLRAVSISRNYTDIVNLSTVPKL
jgi:hypothetical protein